MSRNRSFKFDNDSKKFYVNGKEVSDGTSDSPVVGNLSTTSQANITSVGTLGSLTVSGAATVGSIVNGGADGVGNIGVSNDRFNSVLAVNLYGTLQTASQTNITGVGTLTAGTWNASVINSTYGGMGVNNGGRTLTVNTNSGTISFTNASTTLTVAAAASVSGTNTGDQTTVTGNAGTATTLQTARNINGVSFNGSADITVTAAAGTLTGTTLNSTVVASSLTSVGTLTGLTMSGTITGKTGTGGNVAASNDTGSMSVRGDSTNAAVISFHRPGAYAINMGLDTDNVFKIGGWSDGASTYRFQVTAAGIITGTATSARYADLAEKYTSDKQYVPGTVVVFGGTQEVTVSTVSHDPSVAGVVSTNPAYLMNNSIDGVDVALQGRVPCRVLGPVSKGDRVVSSDVRGVAERLDMTKYQPGCIIGKALEAIPDNEIATIEVVVGRN